jgi:hypothetical protein
MYTCQIGQSNGVLLTDVFFSRGFTTIVRTYLGRISVISEICICSNNNNYIAAFS